MSAEQVAKLEGLLERIQDRRRPRPAPLAVEAAEPITAERPVTPKAPALELAPEAESEDRAAPRPIKPTPMEQALEIELESSPPPAMEDDEPVVEITVDDDEPEITVTHDEPEIDTSEQPTAPLGTRAPAVAASPAAPARESLPISRPGAPAGPVARVVSRPAPRTFGELLSRTLSLRPR
ncbi:MAG: hypothetical protein VYE22_18510 [Myxococcota bacterium]|nr:hypothetical protein [Myxococcota bacterium]